MIFIGTSPNYDIVTEIGVNKSIIKYRPNMDWETIFYSVEYSNVFSIIFGDHIYMIIKCLTIIDLKPKEATSYFRV